MGKKLKMIVVKHHDDECEMTVKSNVIHKGEEHEIEFDLPYEQAANALMSAKGYLAYVKKHGYHFTEALAEHVSKIMENANGTTHSWNAEQVKNAFVSMGAWPLGKVKTEATLGDITYLANMYYADLYPDPFKDELSCLKAAHKIAKDPDGYKGLVFCRWTSDAIGKAIHIDWEKFV